MNDGDWWCEAYGPPEDGVPPESWPRCFLAPDTALRYCLNATVCSATMTAERRRVFDRIHELADEGDEIGAMLAADLTSPDELLGGPGTSSE